MKTVRSLLHGEIIRAVSFVLVGFLALFLFFDLVDELQNLSRLASQGYQLHHALLYVALKTPAHIYELLPISVLIGCIFVMARLAQSSEFTILRTGGLDPLRALGTLLRLGLIFVGLTFVIGDYLAPSVDRLPGVADGRCDLCPAAVVFKHVFCEHGRNIYHVVVVDNPPSPMFT